MERNQSGDMLGALAGLAIPIGALVAAAGAVGIGAALYMRSHQRKHWYSSVVPTVRALMHNKDLIHGARDLMHGAKDLVHKAERVWN